MSASVNPKPPSALAIFRRRSFAMMWTADFISTAGNALTMLASSILIFRLTGSALSVGLIMIATAVPSLVVGLVAGVFVDRYDRKKIMVASDLIRAGLVVLIPILVPYHIAWLYVLVMLTAAVGTFFDPAHESVLPEIASDEELAAANSFIAISSFGSTAVGFAASGLIASLASVDLAFYLDGVTFALSAVCIMAIRVNKLEVEGETTVKMVVKNLGEGFGYLWEITILRSLLIVSFLLSLGIGLWNALLLPFAVRALQASEFVFGVQEALTSVGFVLGSLLMAKIADRLRDGQWVSLGILGIGTLGAVYSQIASIPLAIGLVAAAGFLNAFLRIGQRLMIQRNTTREKRGRVVSVFLVVANLLFTLGMAGAGLADVFDVRLMMLVAGLVMIAGALVSFIIPGLGQPAAHWRRSINLLRQVGSAPGLSAGRAATPADLEALAVHLPAFANLTMNEQQNLAAQSWVQCAEVGAVIVRHNQRSDDAYFLMNGRAVAGREENGSYLALETLHAGDFFGEIAALTNAPRTADVVAEEAATLLQVSAQTLRQMMQIPELNRLFMSKMTERMVRMNMIDLNFGGSLDQQSLRELRTPVAQPA